MAMTLTGLIPTIYESLDIVSRELVGAIPAVSKDTSAEMAAVDQTIRVPIAPASSLVAITPASYPPDSGGQTISYVDMTISKSYSVPLQWTGEEELSVNERFRTILRDQFTQAMRAICNQVETDLLTVIYQNASRAYGTAGTTPFASDLSAAANIKKILDDNGAPMADRTLVIDTTAGVKLRSLANLMTVNASGTDQTLRNGVLLPVVGMDIRESGQIQSHTKGTGTGYDIVAAGEAVGQTTLSLEGGNSGTILKGDVVTFAGGTTDSNKYMVIDNSTINTASGSASGNIPIGNPGLRIVKVDADEMTIGNNYTANVAFHKQAVQLITRQPQMPSGGDGAADILAVTDPTSGITFQVADYRAYRQRHIEVGLAWGYAVIKSEHIAVLLG